MMNKFLITALLTTALFAQANQVEKRVYQVHPTFAKLKSSTEFFTSDVFGTKEAKPSPEWSAKSILESSGVTFNENGSATFDPATNLLTVTNDKFSGVEFFLDQFARNGGQFIYIISEWIETDSDRFSEWIANNSLESDATTFRDEVQKWIETGSADLYDITVVNGLSGHRAKSESGREYIFPTEYDPAEIPEKLTLTQGAPTPITPVTPTAWDIKLLGNTLEVDAVLGGPLSNEIKLSIAVVDEQLKDLTQWPNDHSGPRETVVLPSFYTMKSSATLSLENGVYSFLGTSTPSKPMRPDRFSPIMLRFVRADIGSTKAWKRVEPPS